MSTYLELLEAIHARPDEDTPRLGLADWLIEYGDESQRARGELIQIQCEKWNLNDGPNAGDFLEGSPEMLQFRFLRERESAILKQYADEWRRGPVCYKNARCLAGRPFSSCSHCFGTGDAGGLMRKKESQRLIRSEYTNEVVQYPKQDWSHKVEYVRGMKRVHATLQECVKVMQDNRGGYQEPSDWLLSVVRHHPDVVEVWITDKCDQESPCIWDSVKPPQHENVPRGIFDAISELTSREVEFYGKSRIIEFDSNEETKLYLARGVVRWARSHEKTTRRLDSVAT